MDGRLSVVTAIIKARIVPSCAPFASSASATGMVPKISAYIGIPTRVAKNTPKGLLLPRYSSTFKAGAAAKVAVDTTEVKNIWKANGAKPGMVLYEVYTTVYVTPREGLEKALKTK